MGGLGLIILVCFAMHGGTASAVLGMVGVGGILAGLLLWAHNRSAAQIREQQMLAEAQVKYMAAKVKSGQQITEKDLDDISGLTKARQEQEKKKDTGRIVKGAVVGGIVAGDVGAVVGAVAAKTRSTTRRRRGKSVFPLFLPFPRKFAILTGKDCEKGMIPWKRSRW